jgi:hypothetical protein
MIPSLKKKSEDSSDCDCMVVGFTTTYAISAYHHWRCECELRSWRGVLDATLCDKVCQWFATGRVFTTSGTYPLSFVTEIVNSNKIRDGI